MSGLSVLRACIYGPYLLCAVAQLRVSGPSKKGSAVRARVHALLLACVIDCKLLPLGWSNCLTDNFGLATAVLVRCASELKLSDSCWKLCFCAKVNPFSGYGRRTLF